MRITTIAHPSPAKARSLSAHGSRLRDWPCGFAPNLEYSFSTWFLLECSAGHNMVIEIHANNHHRTSFARQSALSQRPRVRIERLALRIRSKLGIQLLDMVLARIQCRSQHGYRNSCE